MEPQWDRSCIKQGHKSCKLERYLRDYFDSQIMELLETAIFQPKQGVLKLTIIMSLQYFKRSTIIYIVAMRKMYYSPTVVALWKVRDPWPWKAKPYCHSIGLKFLVVGSIPDKIYFFCSELTQNLLVIAKGESKDMYLNGIRGKLRISPIFTLIRFCCLTLIFREFHLYTCLCFLIWLSYLKFGSILRKKKLILSGIEPTTKNFKPIEWQYGFAFHGQASPDLLRVITVGL